MYVRAFTHEKPMGLDRDENVQIPRRSTAQSGLSLAGNPNARAILDARRDINGKGFFSLDTAGADASPAWIIDYPARAMASWTTSFDREKSLLGANLSRAMTARARNRGRAALCSAALAGLAGN